MAGFNTLVDDFNVATCSIHLKNPAGQPAYAVQLGDSVDIAVGSWDITRDDKGNEISRTAIPPTVKGAVIKPCMMVLRSPTSPDAKRFLDKRENTLTQDDILGRTLDKDGNAIMPPEDKAQEWWAAFIADFVDLPHEKDGKTSLAVYSEEAALEMLRIFPGVVGQMLRILFDSRNFGKPLGTG